MAEKRLPSQRLLKRLFLYDLDRGRLVWRERPLWMFKETAGRRRTAVHAAWNTKFAGRDAGSVFPQGYIFVRIFRRNFAVHRLIWKMMYGIDPVCIDHINRVRADNRFCNLRNVALSENAINKSIRSDNTSGVAGVFWHPRFQRWVARIKLRKKAYSLGRFRTKDAAIAARLAAEERLNFHPRPLSENLAPP